MNCEVGTEEGLVDRFEVGATYVGREGLISWIDIGQICWIVGYLSHYYLNVPGQENLKLLRGTV